MITAEVLQAFIAKKQVEYYENGEWYSFNNVDFDRPDIYDVMLMLNTLQFRIKPAKYRVKSLEQLCKEYECTTFPTYISFIKVGAKYSVSYEEAGKVLNENIPVTPSFVMFCCEEIPEITTAGSWTMTGDILQEYVVEYFISQHCKVSHTKAYRLAGKDRHRDVEKFFKEDKPDAIIVSITCKT